MIKDIERIPVYVINLEKRVDRKRHILKQFEGRDEFDVTIQEACEHSNGAIGLWKSFVEVIKIAEQKEHSYVIFCEDDHQFTANYSKEKLLNNINLTKIFDADVLIGGVSWFKDALQINDDIFWVSKFSGTQFIVVFRGFFASILSTQFEDTNTLDFKISQISQNKLFIHPYISVQRDFGYSDVTQGINLDTHVGNLFKDSSFNLDVLKKVAFFYKTAEKNILQNYKDSDLENIAISTYIINLHESNESREHIREQFAGKDEFDIHFVDTYKHTTGDLRLWLGIQKAVELARGNNDDVIIICEDDHEFTPQYRKELLLENIIEGHAKGADCILGGIGGFECSVPVSRNLYWIYSFISTRFIVLFKDLFEPILMKQVNKNIIIDSCLSEMFGNKMVIYPFISTQRDQGYSDVSPIHKGQKEVAQFMFSDSADRFAMINNVATKRGCFKHLNQKP